MNGRDALEGEFPYQISLRQMPFNWHFCGGSIISNRFVLTAAHCLESETETSVLIVAGSVKIDSGGSIYVPLKFTLHEYYSGRFFGYE